ncbi:unnamed protein product [Prunus armeniaca]
MARLRLPSSSGVWIPRPGVSVLWPAEPVFAFSAAGFVSAAGSCPQVVCDTNGRPVRPVVECLQRPRGGSVFVAHRGIRVLCP